MQIFRIFQSASVTLLIGNSKVIIDIHGNLFWLWIEYPRNIGFGDQNLGSNSRLAKLLFCVFEKISIYLFFLNEYDFNFSPSCEG